LSPVCVELCADGIDNNDDGRIDCADPRCDSDPACIETNCTDTIDDEGDGATDCFDSDCALLPVCDVGSCCTENLGVPSCSNAVISACVCAVDSFCCTNEWDQICVDETAGFQCGMCIP